MRISSAKAKGRRLQQFVCEKISQLTGLPWGPDQPITSRPMSQSGTDIRLDREALRQFPFSVECKSQESWAVPAWIKQAQENLLPNTTWLLVAKRRKEPPIVIMDADAFFALLRSRAESDAPPRSGLRRTR
jgi:hypothetical protein